MIVIAASPDDSTTATVLIPAQGRGFPHNTNALVNCSVQVAGMGWNNIIAQTIFLLRDCEGVVGVLVVITNAASPACG